MQRSLHFSVKTAKQCRWRASAAPGGVQLSAASPFRCARIAARCATYHRAVVRRIAVSLCDVSPCRCAMHRYTMLRHVAPHRLNFKAARHNKRYKHVLFPYNLRGNLVASDLLIKTAIWQASWRPIHVNLSQCALSYHLRCHCLHNFMSQVEQQRSAIV